MNDIFKNITNCKSWYLLDDYNFDTKITSKYLYYISISITCNILNDII